VFWVRIRVVGVLGVCGDGRKNIPVKVEAESREEDRGSVATASCKTPAAQGTIGTVRSSTPRRIIPINDIWAFQRLFSGSLTPRDPGYCRRTIDEQYVDVLVWLCLLWRAIHLRPSPH